MVDLHTHTNESDGTDSPVELVEKAWGVGVKTLVITDHDTLSGVGMAWERAGELGLRLIRGV
ncbi:MAG: PHP domain-containing protein, partial [Acidobacteriota bacterium]